MALQFYLIFIELEGDTDNAKLDENLQQKVTLFHVFKQSKKRVELECYGKGWHGFDYDWTDADNTVIK